MRIEIDRIEPAFEGRPFGAVGPYEKLVGCLTAEVDPKDPCNAGIVNLDRAPTTARGRVEYACDFCLLRPADLRRGNRRLFYDVLNRGTKVALHALNRAPRDPANPMQIAVNDPASAADGGDGFLMRKGYSILWTGWQGDLTSGGGGIMAARLPIATDGGRPLVGTSRDEFIFEHRRNPAAARLSYPAATVDQSTCTLTVRQRERDERLALAPQQWRFLSDSEIEITRPAGFDAGAIYEFVYPARDPIVMGLGFAAVRDAVSWLRGGQADERGVPNPLTLEGRSGIDHTLAFGVSQAGRFLRDFLYQGFNEDLAGAKVFDGMLVSVTGARRAFVNHAFAQPGRWSRQHEDRMFPQGRFPFTYAATTDPVSGQADGLLARCAASGTCPKIIHTESSTDFFQGRASLLVTDGLGAPVPLPDEVRLYHFAGVQHGGGRAVASFAHIFPFARHPLNPADHDDVHRALLVALDAWVSGGEPPPASAFPRVEDGTLVSPAPDHYRFPAIPGALYPGLVNGLTETDESVQPPRAIAGRDYAVLVPATDADGNEIAGIRLPEIAVPRGTHTGWNVRGEGHAEGELIALGACFPFATSEAERQAAGDPRPSIAERYPTPEDYARKIAEALEGLCERRLLLPDDAERRLAELRQEALIQESVETLR